jgi:hypothetical protein
MHAPLKFQNYFTRYGDYVPAATSGKLLGAVGVLLGILVVSLPVPIIQNKVNTVGLLIPRKFLLYLIW